VRLIPQKTPTVLIVIEEKIHRCLRNKIRLQVFLQLQNKLDYNLNDQLRNNLVYNPEYTKCLKNAKM